MEKPVNVLVIGGGIAGVSTALYLARGGCKVLLVEAQSLGSGATGLSCATVASVGAGDGSKASHSMTHWTVKTLRELQARATAGEKETDCGFVECGVLELLCTERELQKANEDVEELQQHGYDAHILSATTARNMEPALQGSSLLGALHMPQSGYADPRKTMQALASEAVSAGAEIWEGYQALAATRLTTDSGPTWLLDLSSKCRMVRVPCDHVVIATGAWAQATGRIFGLEVPVARVKAQMWSAKSAGAKLSHVIYAMSSHLFWAEQATRDDSAGTPNLVTHSATGQRYCYHIYGRPSDDDVAEVYFGGDRIPLALELAPSDYEPHTASMQENYHHISYTLPALKLQQPGTWCGIVGSSLHGGILVGEVAFMPGLWLCTGFGGSGFMKAIGAGKAISEWIISKETHFAALRVEADPSAWLRASSIQ